MTVAIMLLMETSGVPEKRLGLAGGLFFTSAEIGGVLGPVAFCTLAYWTGSFVVPLFVVTLAAVVVIALLAML